jgi:hypothetical protein
MTPQRMEAYASFLRNRCASVTVASYLGVLHMAARGIYPEQDISSLLRLQQRLKRHASPSRDKQSRIVPAHQLLQLGLDLIESASQTLDEDSAARASDKLMNKAARDLRDGLLIGLLAARPLRVKNLLRIEIGMHLRYTHERATIQFTRHETKAKLIVPRPGPSVYCPPSCDTLTPYAPG